METGSNSKDFTNINMTRYDDVKKFIGVMIDNEDEIKNLEDIYNILIKLALKFNYHDIVNGSYFEIIDELLKEKRTCLENLELAKKLLKDTLYIENVSYMKRDCGTKDNARVIFDEKNINILYDNQIDTIAIDNDGIINIDAESGRLVVIEDIRLFVKNDTDKEKILEYYSNINNKSIQEIKTNLNEEINNINEKIYNKIKNYIEAKVDKSNSDIDIDGLLVDIALSFGYYNVQKPSYLKSINEILDMNDIHIGTIETLKNRFTDMLYINKGLGYEPDNTTLSYFGTKSRVIFYNKNIGVYHVLNKNFYHITIMHKNSISVKGDVVGDEFKQDIIFVEDVLFNTNSENKQIIIDYYNGINKNMEEDFHKSISLIHESVESISDNCKEIIINFYSYLPNDILLNKQINMAFGYLISLNDSYMNRMLGMDEGIIASIIDLLKKNNQLYSGLMTIVENSYHKLVKVIGKKSDLDESLHSCLTWELIRKYSVSYFAQVWENEYGNYFNDILSDPIENIINVYCRINELSAKDINTVGKFTYYLMDNNKFSNSNYNNFIKCNEVIIDYILKECEQIEMESFERKLTKEVYKKVEYTIDDVDLMTGFEFEDFVGKLFEKMGFSVQVTKSSGDQGVDVLAEKNGNRIGIQAKCYSNTVGNKAVQEIVAGVTFYNCDKGIVVTNNWFTNSAIELAKANNIVLWDRNMLKQKIDDVMNK